MVRVRLHVVRGFGLRRLETLWVTSTVPTVTRYRSSAAVSPMAFSNAASFLEGSKKTAIETGVDVSTCVQQPARQRQQRGMAGLISSIFVRRQTRAPTCS